MPHAIIEYSANIERMTDIDALCRIVHEAILSTGLFELGAVRVRAVRCDHYAIADLQPENAFADVRLRIGEGRVESDIAKAGQIVFDHISAFLEPLYETPHFALSFSIDEIDGRFSWKKNGMHARIRERAQ